MSWFQIRYSACAGFSPAERRRLTSAMRRRIGGLAGSITAKGSRPVNCTSSKNSRTLSLSFRASQPRRKMALTLSTVSGVLASNFSPSPPMIRLNSSSVSVRAARRASWWSSRLFGTVEEIAIAIVGEHWVLLEQGRVQEELAIE